MAEPRRALGCRRGCRGSQPTPPHQLDAPRDGNRAHRGGNEPSTCSAGCRGEEHARNQPAGEREQKVASRCQRRVPRIDGLQRGIDHRGAIDGDGAKCSSDKSGDRGVAALDHHEPGGEDERHECYKRHDAFARQPARPPLREGAPRPLRIAEMQRRGQEPAAYQRQRQHVRDLGGNRCRVDEPETEHRCEPVSKARSGREQDDRRGGMHVRACRARRRAMRRSRSRRTGPLPAHLPQRPRARCAVVAAGIC